MSEMLPYQTRMKEFVINNPRCALLVEMGLGKTRATGEAVAQLHRDFEVHKILVIAPLRVCQSVWPQEIEKWNLGLRVSLVTGSYMSRRRAMAKAADVYIINRENTAWLVDNYADQFDFDMVIVDESTSFKNPSTSRFKKLKKVIHRPDRVVLLTGTPAPNGYLDLWSQMYMIDLGERLGKTITKYKNMYFYPDYMGHKWTLRKDADKIIQKKIRDVCLTLTAEDYLQLPPMVLNTIKVALSGKERSLYRDLEKNMVTRAVEDVDKISVANAAALTNKLLQISNGAAYIEPDQPNYAVIHSRKLDALEDLVDVNPGKPILVAYCYKHDLERLKQRFPKAVELDKKPETINAWNRGEIEMMLAHPASAGHGLNLQEGGSIAVWFGLNWSLELYQQFNARLQRRGQNERVVIHHIVAKDTIDEVVMERLSGKDTTQRGLLNYLKQVQEGDRV